MKRLVAVLAGTVLALVFATSAHAAYDDAISINLTAGTDGDVSTTNSTPQGGSLDNWINMTIGHHGANSAASADGSGWTSETMSQPALSANGAGLGSFRIDLYDGGWGLNGTFNNGAAAANSLERTGIYNGDMPNNWGPTNLGMTLSSIPQAFQDAGYDVYILAGTTQDGTDVSWVKAGSGLHTASFYYELYYKAPDATDHLFRSLAAIQILEIGAAPSWHTGDANKDLIVDLQDFGLLKINYGMTSGAAWEQGDFNADGGVDLQDFGLLKAHYGHSGDASVVPVTAVPEPATMSLLALAGLAVLRRRAR